MHDVIHAPPNEKPDNYRWLVTYEVLREGDRFYAESLHGWVDTCMAGHPIGGNCIPRYIRKKGI